MDTEKSWTTWHSCRSSCFSSCGGGLEINVSWFCRIIVNSSPIGLPRDVPLQLRERQNKMNSNVRCSERSISFPFHRAACTGSRWQSRKKSAVFSILFNLFHFLVDRAFKKRFCLWYTNVFFHVESKSDHRALLETESNVQQNMQKWPCNSLVIYYLYNWIHCHKKHIENWE